jgi:hypothetical protein
MKTTLTLTQGNAYTHTIAVDVNESVTLTFGQLLGHLTHKFFRSTMAMRHSGNKGFSFNNTFDFTIECNGHKVSTLELDETLRAKVRMSNTKDGQKRFTRLMCGMLFSAFGDDYANVSFDDVSDIEYTMDTFQSEVRLFLDTQVSDIF